jgi:predicted RNA-binding protein (virulence factor B family)
MKTIILSSEEDVNKVYDLLLEIANNLSYNDKDDAESIEDCLEYIKNIKLSHEKIH